MKLNGKVYDVLKQVAQIWLPAAGTLYFALAQIWHLPSAEEVGGTVIALDTFLGVVLGISSVGYNNSEAKFAGDLVVLANPGGPVTFSLQGNVPLEEMAKAGEVLFKVITK